MAPYLFFVGALGCVLRCLEGTETERQARLAGRVRVPDAELRRVAAMTDAERRAWYETRKASMVTPLRSDA